MNERSVIERWTQTATRDAGPLVERFVGWARRSREELQLRMLGRDFSDRIGQLRTRYRDDLDPFDLDVGTFEQVARIWAFFHRFYFRTEVHGIDHLPEQRVIVVANHSGQIPIDAAILGCALFFDAEQPRVARAMIDRWAANLPWVSAFFARIGSVVGTPENAISLLSNEESLLVFPEGIKGISKSFAHRYQLQDFGTGFMRIAMSTGSPILPAAVIGAEEQYVSLGNSERLARLLKMPVCPVIPQMYFPGGQLPLPTKYRVYFGEPMRFAASDAKDESSIAERVYLVRCAIQRLIDYGLRRRRSAFW